ncbi:MAG TPA: TraB/GumN family protein [Allosphingosinicella sp.]|nr:TraB/GumN family protein [Allosphingosinicella sp.]
MRASWSAATKRVAGIVAAIGAVAGAGEAAAARTAAAAAPKPALWKLADADTTIYLFGTIHALPKGLKWRTPALERALAEADELVLETVLDDAQKGAVARTALALGIGKGLPPLAERVPADKSDELARLVKASGVPARVLDRLETWAATHMLMASSLRQVGVDPAEGVERGLAGGLAKPVSGLETVEQQLGFLDQLSEEAQRALLVSALEDPAAAKAQFQAMVAAWASGDTDAIARTFDDETMLSPELRQVLMTRRNAAWAEWLRKRLGRPGTVLVAVGAGHLAGKDSVHAMLGAKGLRAERVQ